MADKYSYKGAKKKKAARRPVAEAIGAKPSPAAAPIAASPVAKEKSAAPVAILSPVPARPESRTIARVSNLGAEIKRVSIIGGVVLAALIGASLLF